MYVDTVSIVGIRDVQVEYIDWCGVRRRGHATSLAPVRANRATSGVMLLSLDLQKLRPVQPNLFFECLDLEVRSDLKQAVLGLECGQRSLLLHPTTLITGVFDNWRFWSRYVFMPHVLDSLYWSDLHGRIAHEDSAFMVSIGGEQDSFQQTARWLMHHPTARRFLSSLHWHALNHRLMADLPQGELLVLANAVHQDGVSAITKVRLLAVRTDEPPDITYGAVRADESPRVFVINSDLLRKVAEDTEGYLDDRFPLSRQSRALILERKPDQTLNWLELIKTQGDASFRTL